MSGLAEIALNLGFSVSGSDITESQITNRLKGLGARIYKGHSPENVGDIDTLVFSSAIAKDNPELKEGENRGLNILKRAKLLSFFMEKKKGIAISGAHGKTTTTSLIAAILDRAGLFPTVINGGVVKAFASNAKLGLGEYIVSEVDESDGSFFSFPSRIAVVTNMDREHMEHFKHSGRMKLEYLSFIGSTDMAVLCEDDRLIRNIMPKIQKEYRTYGIRKGMIRAKNIKVLSNRTEFDLVNQGKSLGIWKVRLLGRHNVLNALAAISVGFLLSIDKEIIKEALESFQGVERRLDIKRDDEIMVVEDYGHHPTEIKATIKAIKKAYKRNVIVVFQPHRYTRTKFLLNNFTTCFNLADMVVLTDIYPASEPPIPGITGELLYSRIKKSHPNVSCILDFKRIPEFLKHIVQKGDVILVLGAGDINKIVEPLCRMSI